MTHRRDKDCDYAGTVDADGSDKRDAPVVRAIEQELYFFQPAMDRK